MLFAACAKHHHHHQPALQQQLTALQQLKESGATLPTASATAMVNEEAKEAMRALDAKLIAYLAGEDMPAKTTTEPSAVESNEFEALESLQDSVDELLKERMREQQWELFKSMCSIKLQLEALTLEPEGTKRMELLQSEIRPIFTVECQLSHELIKHMPRYDMFHIMQFESEKFHSLTQCTRFGQQDERNVKLCLDEMDAKNGNVPEQLNCGRIHFTVWWREPGTCLNEMLGMGVLELEELHSASLLEQCKRIAIKRRGTMLANLYLKISLKLQKSAEDDNANLVAEIKDINPQLMSGGGEGEESKNKQPQQIEQKNTEQQAAAQSVAAAATDNAANAALSSGNNNTTNNSDNNNKNANNSNFQLDSSSFAAETTKVRLLKGFIYASETRNLPMNLNCEYVLVCRRFWQDQAAALIAGEGGNFNYQEQFGVINDEQFLRRVDRQHLQLEVWQRRRVPANDGNGNLATEQLEPIGTVQLPLHQFYIAYRDEAMANRLCKGKLPVISIDAWVPLVNGSQRAGELKCLLAIGSEEQIAHLKETRGFMANADASSSTPSIDHALFAHNRLDAGHGNRLQTTGKAINSSTHPAAATTEVKKTSDLLEMLQKALQTPFPGGSTAAPIAGNANATTDNTPLKPLQQKYFKFELEIVGAAGLPHNPAAKGKKNAKRNANAAASKRFPPNEAPSTYVTFQADDCQGSKLHKSHEGGVYATGIIEKCTRPQWQQHFRVTSSVDYLKNDQQRFILKLWKKAATNVPPQRLQPMPMEDAIIGFAALDLTAFMRGLHIAGCFNIVDFNGRINGQLELRAKPLEDVHKILHAPPPAVAAVGNVADTSSNVDAVIDQFENSLDLTHLHLGQAIKRKFTELEEISQRLRTRLADVTGEQLASQFDISTLDKWQPFEMATSNCDDDDADLDEFERLINEAPSTSSAAAAAAAAQLIEEEANKNTAMKMKMISTKQDTQERPDE